MRKCFPAIMLSTGIFAVAVLHANGWTVAASTGVIDEADLNKIILNNDGSASVAPTVNSATAKLRSTLPIPPALNRVAIPNRRTSRGWRFHTVITGLARVSTSR